MKIKSDEPPQHRVASQITRSLKKIREIADIFGAYCSKHFLQVRQLIRGEKKLVLNFGLLFMLAIIPWISEASYNQEIYSGLVKFSEPLDPISTGQFAETISEYTPGVAAKSDEIALTLMAKSDSYSLDQQLAVNAGKDIEGPERQDATYAVQQGETVTEIAEKFDLHVASILDANDMSAEDLKKVKEGTTLVIPSTDTSTSNDWLVAVNKAEEEEKAAALAAAKAEALKKQKLAASRAYAAGSSYTSSSYSGIDTSGLGAPLAYNNGVSRGYSSGHRGIDYMASIGTPATAAAGGKIVKISTGWSGGYGNMIIVDHGGGRATRYAHLSQINVSIGQTVSKGQTIGLTGNTGRSTGPHLHYELIVNGTPVPPR
jgi:murein DD-endopeptidase MepM/ murein hydrolase activator NlpD